VLTLFCIFSSEEASKLPNFSAWMQSQPVYRPMFLNLEYINF
jgi:hypothetical protein